MVTMAVQIADSRDGMPLRVQLRRSSASAS